MDNKPNKANTVLSQMLVQFEHRHQRPPQKVVVVPLACLALALQESLAPEWMGVPVECREVKEEEATLDPNLARSLAVFVRPEGRTGRLVCCDLKT